MSEPADPDFLSPAQFARKVGLHPETVRSLCLRGKIVGAVKCGSAWRIDYEAFRGAARMAPAKPEHQPRILPRGRGSLAALDLAIRRVAL